MSWNARAPFGVLELAVQGVPVDPRRRAAAAPRPRDLPRDDEVGRAVREEVRRGLGDSGGQIEVQMEVRLSTGCR